MENQTHKGSDKKWLTKSSPPPMLKMFTIILSGVAVGLLLTSFYISNAASYLSDDSETCINCHVMTPQFATWERSSHKTVAKCNDCHVPHDNIVAKYAFKAKDGMRHATMFTLRMEPQVIRISESGKEAVQQNCIRCHENNIHPVSLRALSNKMIHDSERVCWDCHREIPHGRVNSLSSVVYSRSPKIRKVFE